MQQFSCQCLGKQAIAGTVSHYVFGVTLAGMYAIATEFAPHLAKRGGLAFGALAWLIADEGVVPTLGLSKSPPDYPTRIHAYSLASHLVSGLTTEAIRRAVRKTL